jgi:hypothetical protein
MFPLRRVLCALVFPLLVAGAGAQLLDVRTVPVQDGVQLLVTRLEASSLATISVLVPPGQQPDTHASGPSLGGGEGGSIEDGAQRYLTRWGDVSGATHLLVTQKLEQESCDQHAQRHKAALDLLLAEFPPGQQTSDAVPLFPYYQDSYDTLVASWVGIDGLDHAVVTNRKAGESIDKWVARHSEGVTALLKAFPKAPGKLTDSGRRVLRLAA